MKAAETRSLWLESLLSAAGQGFHAVLPRLLRSGPLQCRGAQKAVEGTGSAHKAMKQAAACRFVDLLSLHMTGAVSLKQESFSKRVSF